MSGRSSVIRRGVARRQLAIFRIHQDFLNKHRADLNPGNDGLVNKFLARTSAFRYLTIGIHP